MLSQGEELVTRGWLWQPGQDAHAAQAGTTGSYHRQLCVPPHTRDALGNAGV